MCVSVPQAARCPAMEKMKRIKKRLSLTLRSSQTIDESLSELAEQMTIEDGGTKDNGDDPTHLVFIFQKQIKSCLNNFKMHFQLATGNTTFECVVKSLMQFKSAASMSDTYIRKMLLQ